MNHISVDLTGNEARLIFFAIKNKKGEVAQNVRQKLLDASEARFLRNQREIPTRKPLKVLSERGLGAGFSEAPASTR